MPVSCFKELKINLYSLRDSVHGGRVNGRAHITTMIRGGKLQCVIPWSAEAAPRSRQQTQGVVEISGEAWVVHCSGGTSKIGGWTSCCGHHTITF